MQIIHWNIQHGGGSRRMPGIALHLLESGADVIALTEFRWSMGGQLAGVLRDHGWRHQLCTDPPPGRNGVLLCARRPLTPQRPAPCPELAHRWLDAAIGGAPRITVVHLPDASTSHDEQARRKTAAWQALLGELRDAPDAEPRVLIGDLNTGRHLLDEPGRRFTCTALLGKLTALGYRDAYRLLRPDGRDVSWISHTGNGFRLDSAHVSRGLTPLVRAVEYDHEPLRRRLSDHAPVRLSLDLKAQTDVSAA